MRKCVFRPTVSTADGSSFQITAVGEFQGIAPTGKQVKINIIHVWRVANGKAVENWVQIDMLGLMQQLGVLPAPGSTQ